MMLSNIEYTYLENSNSKLILFCKDDVLYNKEMDNPILDAEVLPEMLWPTVNKYYLGLYENQPIFAIDVHENDVTSLRISKMLERHPLKVILDSQQDPIHYLLLRGKQLLYWNKTSVFCSTCGSKTSPSENETAKICSSCDIVIYPKISPAVLVLVERGDEILLARSAHFRPGVYSVLAGFIEAGESAEQTVQREIDEEVGIKVKNIRYFKTQSWPFDNCFMIAFRATYDQGELNINKNEIEDAKWFTIDELPLLPFSSSLSRMLIEEFIKERKK